ncbi:DEAD H (Asp-Glu-Ala-Asp His) box helicase 11, partial [Irineochytrium annulatum]
MTSKGVYGTAGDTGFRRKWDRNEYAQKAAEREERAHPESNNKRKRDEEPPEPKALLKARDAPVDFTKNLNKVQVVQTAAGGVAGQPGFACEVCNIVCKDSVNYLDHINGRMHLKNMGMSMKVEKSTAEQVKAKLEALAKKKEAGPVVDLKARVKQALEKEEEEKRAKKEDKKSKKKRKKEEQEKAAAEFNDQSIAEIMGFGKFGVDDSDFVERGYGENDSFDSVEDMMMEQLMKQEHKADRIRTDGDVGGESDKDIETKNGRGRAGEVDEFFHGIAVGERGGVEAVEGGREAQSGATLNIEVGHRRPHMLAIKRKAAVDERQAVKAAATTVQAPFPDLDDVITFPFPFSPPWPIQQAFMTHLYSCLANSRVGLFESPTGTGKSLSLLCGSLKWLSDHRARLDADRFLEVVAELSKGVEERCKGEPAWVVRHAVRKAEDEAREVVEREKEGREKRRRRVEKIREMQTDAGKVRWKAKRARVEVEVEVEVQEEDHALEEYASDDEAAVEKRSRDLISSIKKELDDDDAADGPEQTKIFYCSRTHSQLSQFVRELQKTSYKDEVKTVSLGSRRNLCINPAVQALKSVHHMNDKCLELQKTGSKGCKFLNKDKKTTDNFVDHIHAQVRDIEDLHTLGREHQLCPYYGSRAAIPGSDIVMLPYNMILQKSTREALGVNLKDNVVIFDEAHNIVDTITGMHSVSVELQQLEACRAQLLAYFKKYQPRLKGKNVIYLRQLMVVLGAFSKAMKAASARKAGSVFKTTTDFVQDLEVDHINLFKLQVYMSESKIAQKLQGFSEQASRKDAKAKAREGGALEPSE